MAKNYKAVRGQVPNKMRLLSGMNLDSPVLDYNTVQWVPTIQRNIIIVSFWSTLKMEAVYSSETVMT
jgi:hypothetical protein